MLRSARGVRTRALLAFGLSLAVVAGPSLSVAGPGDVTQCSPTACAVANVTVTVSCSRPDVRTVRCWGEVDLFGSGYSADVPLPGSLDWVAEGRCRANCSQNQLHTEMGSWNGVTTRRTEKWIRLRFPTVERSSTSRVCVTYGLEGISTATVRSVAPLSLGIDSATARKSAYVERYECNQQ